MTLAPTSPAVRGVQAILDRIASDVSIVADVPIGVADVQAREVATRPAGAGTIHISFRFDFLEGGLRRQGCVLVPLADAQVLAGGLMMEPLTRLDEAREQEKLDPAVKEAVVELGSFFAGAAESALRDEGHLLVQVHHVGCQGVRADVRPRLTYDEGDPLIHGATTATLADYPEGAWHLILPALDCLTADED